LQYKPILVESYRGDGDEKSLIIMKVNHTLSDGIGFIHLLLDLQDEVHPEV